MKRMLIAACIASLCTTIAAADGETVGTKLSYENGWLKFEAITKGHRSVGAAFAAMVEVFGSEINARESIAIDPASPCDNTTFREQVCFFHDRVYYPSRLLMITIPGKDSAPRVMDIAK